jgi:hypothetical protein
MSHDQVSWVNLHFKVKLKLRSLYFRLTDALRDGKFLILNIKFVSCLFNVNVTV